VTSGSVELTQRPRGRAGEGNVHTVKQGDTEHVRRARSQAYLAGLTALILLSVMTAVVALVVVFVRSAFLTEGLFG
jgi:hypothetical protein